MHAPPPWLTYGAEAFAQLTGALQDIDNKKTYFEKEESISQGGTRSIKRARAERDAISRREKHKSKRAPVITPEYE